MIHFRTIGFAPIAFMLGLILTAGKAFSQKLKLKNYSIGYRVFEHDGVGRSVSTMAPLMKNPSAYRKYINSLTPTGFSNNFALYTFRNFYLNIELYKTKNSRFWKHYTIQTGLVLSGKLVRDGFALDEQRVVFSQADTIVNTYIYSLTQKQQFLGATLGLNRRFRISQKLHFVTGFHLHGSVAFLHKYEQQWDTTSSSFRNGFTRKTTRLPDLKGTNFFQWQAMLPLGLELVVYKQRLSVRAEGIASIFIRPKNNSRRTLIEGSGAGLWLIYQPK